MDKFAKIVVKNKEKHCIMFIDILEKNLDFDYNLGLYLLQEYADKLREHENIVVVIDSRKISYINPKLIWEIVYDILKLNDLGKEKIKHQYIITNEGCVSYLLNLITKIHPYTVPTTYCKNNEEVKKFMLQY